MAAIRQGPRGARPLRGIVGLRPDAIGGWPRCGRSGSPRQREHPAGADGRVEGGEDGSGRGGTLALPSVVAVVSLSAEGRLSSGTDVAKAVAGMTIPTLLVTADHDPYGSAEALPEIRAGPHPGAEPHRTRRPAPHGTAHRPDRLRRRAVPPHSCDGVRSALWTTHHPAGFQLPVDHAGQWCSAEGEFEAVLGGGTRAEDAALRFLDADVVDAGLAASHGAVRVELPQLVAV
jgi:hypothetical protein